MQEKYLIMKLTKENVYVSLKGKSKEELTDLYEFLVDNGEKPYRDLECFLIYSKEPFEPIGFTDEYFCGLGFESGRTEVTIEQLKQIIKPMESLQDKVNRLELELKKAKQELEDSKPKVGDICVMDNGDYKFITILEKHDIDRLKIQPLPTEIQEQLKQYLK